MASLRLVLGDQLSAKLASLRDVQHGDVVLMAEVAEEATYVPHHPQKITLIFSAMRHFAQSLRTDGLAVDYVSLTDPDNSGTLLGEVCRALGRHRADRVILTEPGEWRLLDQMKRWPESLGLPVELREDDRFLCSHQQFQAWAKDRKQLRMEHFYRQMRKKTGWLMRHGQPAGGAWNYDRQNRRKLPKNHIVPGRKRFPPDAITSEVMKLVANRFAGHFGALESFGWPVTREQALQALAEFIEVALPQFGDYQDAMHSGEDLLYHSLLSPCLNIGLLGPTEVCEAVLEAYDKGIAPLNCVEGFIRQVLGWREFVRGVYWLKMPEYADASALLTQRDLPDLYWGASTDMYCMRAAVDATRRNAYAHHIQRLMITGNFALLAGIQPDQIEAWYLAVYADAFEWVELPNTHGMALFADGGLLGSKPYAASGAYIQRMSDYCRNCAYDPKQKTGESACPFNFLYWDFLLRNQSRLEGNPRMALPYKHVERMDTAQIREIRNQAEVFLDQMYTD